MLKGRQRLGPGFTRQQQFQLHPQPGAQRRRGQRRRITRPPAPGPGLQGLLDLLARLAKDEPGKYASFWKEFGAVLKEGVGEDVANHGIDTRHERVGANQLEKWFGPEVVEPIRMHADSKRYLCWKEAGYFADLSAASKQSLALQGGPMEESEAREFEKRPQFERAIRVRRFDDQGKIPDMKTPTLEDFRPLVESMFRL